MMAVTQLRPHVTSRYVTDNEHFVHGLLTQPRDSVAGRIVQRQKRSIQWRSHEFCDTTTEHRCGTAAYLESLRFKPDVLTGGLSRVSWVSAG